MFILILACEIAFWLFVAGGLGARYWLGRRRLGAVLLALAPGVDAVLLAVVAWDLSRGAHARLEHALAVIYLAISLAYGHKLIRWADRWVAARCGGPAVPRLTGRAYAADCWRDTLRTALALAVAAGLAAGLTLLAEPGHALALVQAPHLLGILLVVDVIWSLSYTVWPRREEDRPGRAASAR